jgi:cation transport ATPase
LFPEFDVNVERVTARILRALSRYEGIEDLSVETLQSILMSEALRQRMADGPPEAEEEAILREAFVERTRLMESQLEAALAERDTERKQRRHVEEDLSQEVATRTQLARQAQESGARITDLENKLGELRGVVRDRETETAAQTEQWKAERAQNSRRWFWLFAVLTFTIFAAGALAVAIALERLEWPLWLRAAAAVAVSVSGWLLICEVVAVKMLSLRDWRAVRILSRVRVAFFDIIAATLLGILVDVTVETIRTSPGTTGRP